MELSPHSAQIRGVNEQSTARTKKNVWVILLQGAVVVLSERKGGAKLEYLCNLDFNLQLSTSNNEQQTKQS